MFFFPSPAKLNLFLYITGQREDGYHTLQTLFQFLDYCDIITIELRQDGQINLLTSFPDIADENNLIIRATHLLMKEAKRTYRLPKGSGANIYVKKLLPIGGGLGGGSSNAATVLLTLNYLWGCRLSESELITLGLMLGVDVPIFILGHSVFVEGISEIYSLENPKENWYLVVSPKENVSTSTIFKDPELPRNTPKRSIEILLNCEFKNDCEIVVRKRFYIVDITISWLKKYAPTARLTGTGSCAFAEFNSEFAARQVLEKAPEWINGFVAKGLNLSPLKHAISRQFKNE